MIQILGLILVGLVIGVLARLIVPGKQRLSMLATLLLGVAGAIIGGFLASLIGMGSITELNFVGFVLAVVAAVLLDRRRRGHLRPVARLHPLSRSGGLAAGLSELDRVPRGQPGRAAWAYPARARPAGRRRRRDRRR